MNHYVRQNASTRFLFTVLVSIFAVLLAVQTRTLAIGTAAGTVISNQAYVDYEDANGNSQARVFSNTVTTTVSQVAAVNLTPDTDTNATDNSVTTYFPFDLINNGNGTDAFDLAYVVQGASDWTPTAARFYLDAGVIGVYEPGTDTEITAPYEVTGVAADATVNLILALDVPDNATAPDGDSSIVDVTATSQFNGAVSDTSTFTATISASVITALKSRSPANPQPGDTVTYTIVITNAGGTNATSVVLTDAIPGNSTYLASSITLGGVGKTDASDADEADFNVTNPGEVTVNAGTIASGGGTKTITFQITVNANVPAGTVVTNTADVAYNSGPNSLSVASNGASFTVAQEPDVDIAAGGTSASGDPSDVIVYPITITNNGNDDDVLDITYTSSEGWTFDVWVDDDNNGIPGTGTDYQLTDTDADTDIDTDTLTQGQSLANLLLVVTIPAATPDATVDTTTVTVASSIDTGVTDAETFTTTVTAPMLSIAKTVSPVGNQPPGTTLTYTITVDNSGSGAATNVLIKDVIPANTTYVAGSILAGTSMGTLTARTDASDTDSGTYDSGADTVECGSTGTATVNVGAAGTFICRFDVTID